MKKLVALTIAGVLIFCVACWAFGDVQVPHFYKVKVTLRDGTSITGGSYGLLGFFGSRLSANPVKSVALSHTNGSIKGHVQFFGNPETKTYERSGNGLKLRVYTYYKTITEHPAWSEFYLIKEEKQVPLNTILRVDTLKIMGKGFAIYQDPAVYADIKEPYLMVETCGLGCPAKLYSEDASITKEKLQKLWDTYLACKHRVTPEGSKRMDKIMSKYQLKIMVDPFCID
ncbi:MAG: hypothetical protein JXA50_11115 [Deltaproteobacteria bacterium]|nr:hypothetical protein [Deltaproteobacteria bacterium]